MTSSAAERATVIRDAATLRPLRRLRGGGTRSALSPDGRVVALGAADGSVRLLDLHTGDLRVATDRHAAAVTDLRFTRDSRTLMTTGADGRLNAWNVADARRIETFTGHAGTVSRVTIAPDGRTAYSAGQDGTVIAWALAGSRRLDRPFRAPPRSAQVFPADVRGTSPTVFAPFGPIVPVAGLAVATTPDGGSFAVPDDAGYVDVFDSRTLTQPRRIAVSPGKQISAVALAPDGRTVAATTADGQVRFADLRDPRPARAAPAGLRRGGMVARVQRRRPLARHGRRQRAVAAVVGRPPPEDRVHPSDVSAADVTLSPDGTKLVAAVHDNDGATAIEILSVPRLALLKTVRARAVKTVRVLPRRAPARLRRRPRPRLAVRHAHVEAARPSARRSHQRRGHRQLQPRRANAGHHVRRRHDAPVGRPFGPRDRRRAARPRPA